MPAEEQAGCTLNRDQIIGKKEEVECKRQASLKRMEILAQEQELLANNLKILEEEDRHWDAELVHLENANVPVLCLPNEITSLIFEMARGQSKFDNERPNRGWSWRRPEIQVTRVCRDWRQVALSCPTIWSHLVIDYWSDKSDKSLQRLRAYLIRSQDTLLDIVVNIKRPDYIYLPVDQTKALSEVLLALAPHSARWQRLVMWLDGKWNISQFSLLTGISAPQLEIFEIGSWPTWGNHRPPRALDGTADFENLFQLGAPKLKFAVTCAQLVLPPHSDFLSTLYIQESVKRLSWAHFSSLIGLPNLRNLTLDGPIFEAPEASTPITRTVMHKLRYLRLGCPIASQYMWDIIHAPKLIVLVLFEMSGLKVASRGSTFPRGFFPALKTLAFWKVETTRLEDLLNLAIATSHVEKITICDCKANSTFMLSLYEYSFMKHSELWPQLQKLVYVVTEPELCFGNRIPKTYKEARETLVRLVDWRLETFACSCTLMIEMMHLYEDEEHEFLPEPYGDVPLYDGSSEEEAHWQSLFLPQNYGRLIPWPNKELVDTGYYGKIKFTKNCLKYPESIGY